MRGTGSIALNGTRLYAYSTPDGGTIRVRVSCDEWDMLGLSEGQRVAVGLPDAGPQDLLILAASRTPPFVWLEMGGAAGRPAG